MIQKLNQLLIVSLVVALPSPAGAQRNLKNIPDPDPELERRSFIVHKDFEVNLFAADPQMAKPIQMNFDARGRLWIASSEVYPHIKPGQVANDKILVLEDKNGDGKSDSTTVFSGGLLIPTGVLPGDGGAYVCNSTELIHLSDTNGDGKADRRRVVLSGFGTEDTHHLLHTLRWGHDGAIYMNQSIYIHSHVETPHGVKRLGGGGIWRFRPHTMELDILCRGFVNPWGHHFDRWGQSFATDGAYREGINYVFPGAVYFTAVGAKRILAGLNPGSPKHCGLEILSGRHLPAVWRGSMVTNDFRAHRVCRFVVSESGAGYSSRQMTEIIKTKHVAFRPIDVKMGPDGAIYIADWYNPIIQHGEVDFRDKRRDHTHGRIWRITAKGRKTLKHPNLPASSNSQLLEHLKSPEEWVRLHAKLTLKSRPRQQVIAELNRWLTGLKPAAADYEHHRLEALWLCDAIDHVHRSLLNSLLASKDHRVRAAAVRVTGNWLAHLPEESLGILSKASTDSHPRVRLEAIRVLAKTKSRQAPELVARVLDQPMDRFIEFAAWQSFRDLRSQWLPGVLDGSFTFGGRSDHMLYALRAIDEPSIVPALLALLKSSTVSPGQQGDILTVAAKLGGPRHLGQVWNMVTDFQANLSDARRASLMRTLVRTSRDNKKRPMGDLSRVKRFLEHKDPRLQAAGAAAIGTWKLARFRPKMVAWARGEKTPDLVRTAAMQAVARLGGPPAIKLLTDLSGATSSRPRRLTAIQALADLDLSAAAEQAAALLADKSAVPLVDQLTTTFLQRTQGPPALIKALQGKKLPVDVAKIAVRTVKSSSQPAPKLMDALRRAGSLKESGWKLTPSLLQELVASVQRDGSARRGESVYRRAGLQCMKCHGIGGAGGRVGPDLISVGASAQVDYLIESLIEPNKKVKENFHSLMVLDDDGKITSGIPVRKTKTELVLRDAEDRLRTIPISKIDQQKQGRSVMPDGLVDSLTRSELVDLVRFLSELGKVGDFAIGKEVVARRWQTLLNRPAAQRRLQRTSFDTAATNDPLLQWQPAYSTVAGLLPVSSLPRLKRHGETPSTSFVRCQIVVTNRGEFQLSWKSVAGLQIWIDGRPTPPKPRMKVSLERGRHVVTVAINREARRQSLRLELNSQGQARGTFVTGK